MNKVYQLLIIDDDKASMRLSEEAVKELSITDKIITCSTAFEALRYIIDHCMPTVANIEIYCPELILLDIHMPVINGYQFLAELHRMEGLRHKNTSIIIISSASYESEKDKIKYFPVVGYIEKPVTVKKLSKVLGQTKSPLTKS